MTGIKTMEFSRLIVAILSISLLNSCEEPPKAGQIELQPYPGVRYVHCHVKTPREIDMHVVIVEMNQPGVRIKTTGPNGEVDTDTDFETTRQFVSRSKAQIGINGGFFHRNKTSIRLGKGKLCSLAVSDGVKVAPWGRGQNHAVNIGKDNTIAFLKPLKGDKTGYATTPGVELYNVVAGNVRLIQDGKVLAKGGKTNYPQTAVGQTADHKLILFVSDGRQSNFSEGMSYEEVANVLREFGAVDAIALDGGGSATMVMVDPKSGEAKVLNRPSDGSERPVGNNLAVIVK